MRTAGVESGNASNNNRRLALFSGVSGSTICKSFSFWGIRNDLSWVHPARVAPENAALASLYALPFDENYAPTPVFDAVVQAWEVQSALPSLGGPAFIALVIALSACGILAAPRTRARPCWTRHESRVP